MSRYDPNSMTRVLNLEKYDYREKSSVCSSDSEEDESINGIFNSDGVVTTNTSLKEYKAKKDRVKARSGGYFGIKRLGLGRKDREKDAADAAGGGIDAFTCTDYKHCKSDEIDKLDTESKLRNSVETNSDETYMTFGTTMTGDHVNALLRARGRAQDKEADSDDYANEGVEDYWKATDARITNIHDSKATPDEEEEEIPIMTRISDGRKATRRNTSSSMHTAIFDNDDVGPSEDDEDDLSRYAQAMLRKDSMPSDEKRSLFKDSSSSCNDAISTAETAKVENTREGLSDDDGENADEENGLKKPLKRRSTIERLTNFIKGGEPVGETYDLRAPRKDTRRNSGCTVDSFWSFNRRASVESGRSIDSGNNYTKQISGGSQRSYDSGNYANDDDNRSHNSGGTFDNSWLGLGNIKQKNGHGGASWRNTRRVTLTPFVDYNGDSFHSQRSSPYRPGERTMKRCICIFFVLAIVVLSGALIGIDITSNDGTLGDPLTKINPSQALTEEEKLVLAESVNQACNPLSIESSDGRHKCQQNCHNHFCCFDDNHEDAYNCQNDAGKYCSVYAGCVVLVNDLVKEVSTQTSIDHVDPNTLAARVTDACSNVETSMGKLECHKVCDDHMCCFELDSSTNCRNDHQMECYAYTACAVLSDTDADEGGAPPSSSDTALEDNSIALDKPSPPLPSWDTAEPVDSNSETQKIDYASDENDIQFGSQNTVSPVDNDSVVSSEGVSAQEIDDACQNLSTSRGRSKCVKLCVEHMCCFESDEDKACLENSDCSVYGSCVLLGGKNATLDSAVVSYDYDPTNNNDDEYNYDDDILIVDTEDEEKDAYESIAVFHVGNRTLSSSNQSDFNRVHRG